MFAAQNYLSASRLWLAEVCPGFLRQEWVDKPIGYSAQRGNEIHAYLEWAMLHGEPGSWAWVQTNSALKNMHPKRRRWVIDNVDIEWLSMGLDVVSTEVTYAYNYQKGTFSYLGSHIGRDNIPRTDEEITGTVDFVAIRSDGSTLVVGDYKTGSYCPSYLLPAESNIQTGFAGLAVATLGVGGDDERVAPYNDGGTMVEARVIHGRKLVTNRGIIDQLSMKRRLDVICETVYVPEPKRNPGEHCWQCPAYTKCDVRQEGGFDWRKMNEK